MTGILEQIFANQQAMMAELGVIKQALNGHAAATVAAPAASPPGVNIIPAPATPATDAFGFPATAVASATQHTEESVMALIKPYLSDQALREQLSAEMAACGVQKVSDAQAHQYNELYQRFSAIIAKHTAAPAGGPATPAAQSQSII